MVSEDEYEAYVAWERKQSEPEFFRQCVRKTKLKRHLTCGHTIDGSEPYRYIVWKPRGERLEQRTDCDTCKRRDNSY